jgi:23S rRNA (uridine2552-2'-O)-methyltransferase
MAGRRSRSGTRNPYQRPDAKTLAAKAQGYPARSVFKLEEIDRRVRLLRPGQTVLDLGAAPGSWAMYASTKVGRSGRVVAIDLTPIAQALADNVIVVVGDALDHPAVDEHAPYDVVLSDMAPRTTGSKLADQFRSYELCSGAIQIATRVLAAGGAFVGKIFMSDDFQKARAELRDTFEEVKTIRPEGTRTTSYEVFLIGLRRKAPPP